MWDGSHPEDSTLASARESEQSYYRVRVREEKDYPLRTIDRLSVDRPLRLFASSFYELFRFRQRLIIFIGR